MAECPPKNVIFQETKEKLPPAATKSKNVSSYIEPKRGAWACGFCEGGGEAYETEAIAMEH